MQASSEHENAMTELIFGMYNSASILIMRMSYWPALNTSSILLCILSLCIKLVLTKNNVSLSIPAVLQG
jgi:hypothetical protein